VRREREREREREKERGREEGSVCTKLPEAFLPVIIPASISSSLGFLDAAASLSLSLSLSMYPSLSEIMRNS